MTDRLSLANALADGRLIDRPPNASLPRSSRRIHDSVASKADLQRFEGAMSAGFQLLEAGTTAEFAAVRSEMALIEHRLLTRLGSLIAIVAGLLFAALRYLPPAH